MLTTADKLKKGRAAVVLTVDCRGALRKRLFSMGVTPGAPIIFIRPAPLGDPLEFIVRDYRIAIRRSEARTITVEYDKTKWTKRMFI